MATALITGSSSGIGAVFADRLAGEHYDLVLVARDHERLEQQAATLKERFGVATEVLVADLDTDDGMHAVEKRLQDTERPIDFLINNAGFGLKGAFHETDVEKHVSVLRVNALAVLRLTHAALEVMVPRGSGDVLNVASVAAFTPGIRPSSTYAASKAFVAALTEGLAPSLIGTGVHLSAVFPGWTRSEFHSRAGMGMKKLPKVLWLTPEKVVDEALEDHRARKVVSVPGFVYKIIMGSFRAMPRPMVRIASRVGAKLSH